MNFLSPNFQKAEIHMYESTKLAFWNWQIYK